MSKNVHSCICGVVLIIYLCLSQSYFKILFDKIDPFNLIISLIKIFSLSSGYGYQIQIKTARSSLSSEGNAKHSFDNKSQ